MTTEPLGAFWQYPGSSSINVPNTAWIARQARQHDIAILEKLPNASVATGFPAVSKPLRPAFFPPGSSGQYALSA